MPAFLKKKTILLCLLVLWAVSIRQICSRSSNVIDYGMDIQTAIDFPRSFPENGYLKLEEGYSDTILQIRK